MKNDVQQQFKIALVSLSIKSISTKDFILKITDFIQSAYADSVKIVLFPEWSIAPLLDAFQQNTIEATKFLESEMTKLALKFSLYICGGSGVYNIDGAYYNQAFFINPMGEVIYQPKINLIESEKADGYQGGNYIHIITTPWVKLAICICYDIEFPELVRKLVLEKVDLILNPSYTKDIYGVNRVRFCAQARAIENHIYIAKTCLVGSDGSAGTECGLGNSALYAPIDNGFNQDGVVAQMDSLTDEGILITEIDLGKLNALRSSCSTNPLKDYMSLEVDNLKITV